MSGETYQKSVLENGLRVLTSPLSHTRAVSVTLFVGAGSRYEDDGRAGVSHFVEHMLFKGTERRRAPQEISEAIERVGGVLNAATDKEATVYWAKVPCDHFSVALDVLLDQLLHSRFDAVELERERKVVLEELAMVEDSPGEIMGLLLDDLLWPEEPLGRDIAGSRESVEGLSRDALLDYVGSQYVPGNVVLSVAGDLSHDDVIEQASSHVDRWQPGSFASWQPARDGHTGPRVAFRRKQTEQAQIGFGYPAYSAYHPDRHALDVLNAIVGDGMSSRLFVEVRENRGLAYSVHSHVARYLDTGAFGVSAAVAPGQVDETIRTILQVLDEVRGTPVSDDELDKAKSYISGRFLLRMEDSRAVASWVGGQELLKREVQSVEAVLEEIGAVGQDDVLRVAKDVIRDDRVHLAVVGPYRSGSRFSKLLT